MGCGGGADMIRDGLWEREREEEEKMAMRVARVRSSRIWASSCTAAALLRTAISQSPLYSNEPIDDCQQLSACDGSACFYLLTGPLRSPQVYISDDGDE
jgi:hypothetical protein